MTPYPKLKPKSCLADVALRDVYATFQVRVSTKVNLRVAKSSSHSSSLRLLAHSQTLDTSTTTGWLCSARQGTCVCESMAYYIAVLRALQ